jgi:phosphate transport system protein
MRSIFQEQIDAIEQQIVDSIELAVGTLTSISRAVVRADRADVESIAAGCTQLRDSCRKASESIVTTMALQAPVARDLRLMLVLLEIAHHGGLVANQFEDIAAHLREIDAAAPDPVGTAEKLARMADLAGAELTGAATALRMRDPQRARRVWRDDSAVNRLNRDVFATTLLRADHLPTRELALRHVLVARSLERVGDNAVDIAEQAAFLATGEYREFTDASRPMSSAGESLAS